MTFFWTFSGHLVLFCLGHRLRHRKWSFTCAALWVVSFWRRSVAWSTKNGVSSGGRWKKGSKKTSILVASRGTGEDQVKVFFFCLGEKKAAEIIEEFFFKTTLSNNHGWNEWWRVSLFLLDVLRRKCFSHWKWTKNMWDAIPSCQCRMTEVCCRLALICWKGAADWHSY